MIDINKCKGCYYDKSDYDCPYCLKCKNGSNYAKCQEDAYLKRQRLII